MGIYINPPNQRNSEWLLDNGLLLAGTARQHRWGDMIAVCMIDNGFIAAGVCYTRAEYLRFADPDDRRQKWWFLVPIEKLIEVGAIAEREDIE